MTYREKMIENRENLGWCKPISYFNGRVIVAINNCQVVGVQLDGTEVPPEPDKLFTIAKMINPDCDADAINRDFEIAVGARGHESPCCGCPWFDACDAMDDN